MSTIYETVAAVRPRVRRDVLFTAAYDGVLFHTSAGGFKITSPSAYKLSSLLIPYLDGRRTVEELCGKLPEPQRAMVGELVGALLSRGFARDVPAAEADAADVLGEAVAKQFASQIGYIDHYSDRAPERFAAFRDHRATVVGSGPIAQSCAVSLVRNGMAQVEIVGESDGSAEAEAAGLTTNGIPAAVISGGPPVADLGWADLTTSDVVLVAGRDAAGTAHRLLTQGVPAGKTLIPAWVFGDQAVVGPATGPAHRGCWYCAMLRLTANGSAGAATEIWRSIAVGDAPAGRREPVGPLAAMIGNLLAFEVFRLATGALDAETDGALILQHLDSLDVVTEQLLPHPRCAHCRTEATADSVHALELDVAEPSPQDDAAVDAAAERLSARELLVQPRSGVFQRYDDEAWEQTPVKVGTVRFADAAGVARSVNGFDVHHVVGARTRALAKAAVTYADGFGAGCDDSRTVTGTSLISGSQVVLRRCEVEPFGPADATRPIEPTTAGAGAGFDTGSAIRDGLASALAYRALLAAIDGAAPLLIPLAELAPDPELLFLTRSAANLGVTVQLLDLGAGAAGGAHVLLARSVVPDGPSRWAIAADPCWRVAAVRALTDLVGAEQVRQQAPNATDATDGAPLLTDFDPNTLSPSGTGAARLGASGTWQAVLTALDADDTDAVWLPIGGSDLPTAGLMTLRIVLMDRSAA